MTDAHDEQYWRGVVEAANVALAACRFRIDHQDAELTRLRAELAVTGAALQETRAERNRLRAALVAANAKAAQQAQHLRALHAGEGTP